MLKRGLATAAAVLLSTTAALAAPSPATLQMLVTEANQGLSSGLQSGSTPLTWTGALGAFTVNVVTGTAQGQALALNSVNITCTTGTDSLTLKLTEQGLTGLSPTLTNFLSAVGGTLPAGSTLSFNTYIDNTNAAFGMGSLVGSQSFVGSGALSNPNSFSGNPTGTATPGSVFSETIVVTVNVSGSAQIGFHGNVAPGSGVSVPEPGALFPLAVGLMGLGYVIRRQRSSEG